MSGSMPDISTIESALTLACRAPSLHNSQPWRWSAQHDSLHLYSDADRLLPSTDTFGRQLILSCGAALNHLQVAFQSKGWCTAVHRVPNPADPAHLASIRFQPADDVSATDLARADAIDRRRTDRLPFGDPAGWSALETRLRLVADAHAVRFDVLDDGCRPQLARASELTASLRRYDSLYQAELHWWSGHSGLPEGVPRAALPSEVEHEAVPAGRRFPSTHGPSRQPEVAEDRSRIVVLTTKADSRLEWLHSGEALSALLLEATASGLATCSLTHLTEMPQSREILRNLIGGIGLPQIVIRVGTAPHGESGDRTPRRPLADVFSAQI